MSKCELTNKQWNCIQDMLYPKRWGLQGISSLKKQANSIALGIPRNGNRGNQWKDHRQVMNGILWILKNGAPWRSLPSEYGCWKTVYKKFCLWTHEGFWDKVLQRLQSHFQSKGKIDWQMFNIDGSNIRSHKSSAGAKKHKLPGRAGSSCFRL